MKLKTNPSKYFRLLLEIYSAFKPFSTLTKRHKDVFAELLHYNYIYREVPEEERTFLIFNERSKTKMMKYLGMSLNAFDTTLSKLRSNEFISSENKINPKYNFKYLGSVNITFKDDN